MGINDFAITGKQVQIYPHDVQTPQEFIYLITKGKSMEWFK
jgi:hypothetical protein